MKKREDKVMPSTSVKEESSSRLWLAELIKVTPWSNNLVTLWSVINPGLWAAGNDHHAFNYLIINNQIMKLMINKWIMKRGKGKTYWPLAINSAFSCDCQIF